MPFGRRSDDSDELSELRSKLRFAKSLVAKQMHEYDVLGEVPKIHWEPPATHPDPAPKLPTRYCAHAVPLHEVCTKCGRDEADALVYLKAAEYRLRELLRIIS